MPDFDYQKYMDMFITWIESAGPRVLIILIMAVVAIKGVGILSRRLTTYIARDKDLEGKKRADTVSFMIKYVLDLIVIVVTFLMLLNAAGIEIGPLLAAAGIVGLAVGFGSQQLVQDVISGFFMLVEDQVRVGDVVSVAGKSGLVEKVNLRMVILRDLTGSVHFIRNGQIDTVTNMTKDFSFYIHEIGVAYREDYDEVTSVVRKAHEELREDPEYKDDILEPIEILGLDAFGDSAIVIKARTKTVPIKQWRVGREFNRRLKKAFDENNIEIPFPHRTIYMGVDKDGSAPAANLRMVPPDMAGKGAGGGPEAGEGK